MSVMSALSLAFIVGLGITWTNSSVLKSVVSDSRDIVALLIKKLIIPIVPWFVGSIFAGLAAKGDLFASAMIFGKNAITHRIPPGNMAAHSVSRRRNLLQTKSFPCYQADDTSVNSLWPNLP